MSLSRNPARALMVQGTTSDAGKSTLVAGLCRLLARRGVHVAPFKPQNMALNSAVGVDGGELGRSQALQALAARVPPHSDMNPILLKPSSDRTSQLIVHGQPVANYGARDYHAFKPEAMKAVLASYRRLSSRYQAIVVEGAGSPAEINLREGDIANMGFAERVDCPVVLIADIDRGGVFAHLVGTLAVLPQTEQDRIVGFVINRFRGDIGLLEPGLKWLEARTGKPVLGVLPYLKHIHLDAEDALPVNGDASPRSAEASLQDPIRVIAPALPRIANATDADPLRLNPAVDFCFVPAGAVIPAADLIVLPGSKSVRADLAWLRDNGWVPALSRHLRYGGKVLGICGGLQMLGRAIHDPRGVEGAPGTSAGFGWLDLETTLHTDKQLRNVTGRLALGGAASVTGYEIHMGLSTGPDLERPAVHLDNGGHDGARSADGQIVATYLHGVLDDPAAASAILDWVSAGHRATQSVVDLAARRETDLDRLADCLESHLDLPRLSQWLPLGPAPVEVAPGCESTSATRDVSMGQHHAGTSATSGTSASAGDEPAPTR